MRGVKSPRSPPYNGQRSPRVRPPKYIYTEKDEAKLNEIALSVINGLAMESIEPTLFPILTSALNIEKRKQFYQNNQSAVDQINRSLKFISDYHQNIENKEELKAYDEQTQFTDEEVDAAANALMEGQEVEIISQKFFQAISTKLKQIKVQSLKEKDYLVTDAAQNALRDLFCFENEIRYLHITEEMERKNYKNTFRAQKNLNAVRTKWDNDLNEQKTQREYELNKLNKDKVRALRNFDREQQNAKPPRYRPSNNVIELRRKVEYLINLHRKDDALETKAELNALEKHERDELIERYNNSVQSRRAAIESKYDEQIYSRATFYERNIERLEKSANKEVMHAERCVDYWETQKPKDVLAALRETSPAASQRITSPAILERTQRSSLPILESSGRTTPRQSAPSSPRCSPRSSPRSPRSPRLNAPPAPKSPISPIERAYNKVLYSKAINERNIRF